MQIKLQGNPDGGMSTALRGIHFVNGSSMNHGLGGHDKNEQ